MGGGGGGNTTTIQKADPWSGQQPYLTDIFSEAQNMYRNMNFAPPYYPGSAVAPMDSATQKALDLQEQRALTGSPMLKAGQNELMSTLQGNYLNSNPYLDNIISRSVGQTASGVNSGFMEGGRYGSGAQAMTLADKSSEIANDMYYQNYNDERTRQMQAALISPQMAQADYQDLAALSEVGTARENYAQEFLNEDINRYNYEQSREAQALQAYNNLIQGNYGGSSSSSTSTSGGRSNSLGGVLAGGLGGAGLMGILGAEGGMLAGTALGGPLGLAVGAGLGGLLGLL